MFKFVTRSKLSEYDRILEDFSKEKLGVDSAKMRRDKLILKVEKLLQYPLNVQNLLKIANTGYFTKLPPEVIKKLSVNSLFKPVKETYLLRKLAETGQITCLPRLPSWKESDCYKYLKELKVIGDILEESREAGLNFFQARRAIAKNIEKGERFKTLKEEAAISI